MCEIWGYDFVQHRPKTCEREYYASFLTAWGHDRGLILLMVKKDVKKHSRKPQIKIGARLNPL